MAVRRVLLIVMIWGVLACSTDEFSAEESNSRTRWGGVDVRNSNNQVIVPSGNVEGLWLTGNCQNMYDDGKLSTTQDSFKLEGMGDHKLQVSEGSTFEMKVDFQLCPPQYHKKNIVFVVDTSGTMRDTYNLGRDPLSNGSCGRLEIARSYLDSLPEKNSAKIGFVTFSTDVDKSSERLYSADEFRSKFLDADHFCHRMLGMSGIDSNYKAGLTQAESFLNDDPDKVSAREVYLISDGLPGGGSVDGRDVAKRLREDGLVGTILIGTNDAFLKGFIASEREDGSPLHEVYDSGNKSGAGVVDELVAAQIESGEFRYRAQGREDWYSFELDMALDFFHVTEIVTDDFYGILEIEIIGQDSNGATYLREGRLDVTRQTEL